LNGAAESDVFMETIVTRLLILGLLVLTNAFFAASEIAIISLNDTKLRKMAGQGHVRAKLLAALLKEPSRFLATIQVGVTLSGFLASAFAAESFAKDTAAWLGSTIPSIAGVSYPLAIGSITLVLAYFSLVFGELVPKRIAMQYPDAISMAVVPLLALVARLAAPFVHLLSFSTNLVAGIFGVTREANQERVTEEEIRMVVDEGQEKGVIRATEKAMINNILEFDNTEVTELMIHRSEIIALPDNATLSTTLETVTREKFTRLPVYQGNLDNILGILHVKDLLQFVATGKPEEFELKKLLRPASLIPFCKKTDELFHQMQRDKNHMAIVVDEYGGTAGLVTMEDLVEEIVGSIQDEYDEEEAEFIKTGDRQWQIKGQASLETVSNLIGTTLDNETHETLGGFLSGQLGRIPADGEKPVIKYGGYAFKVEEVRNRRILKVQVERMK
jgi:putative hemolysin